MKSLKAFFGILVLAIVFVGGYVISNANEEKYITLEATFRMGGAVYKGYEFEGNTLVFKFDRSGDFFTQAIETKEFTTDKKLSPEKVIMEINTNGKIKRYEAKLIEEGEDIAIYKASEL
ncbi:hypothetical protein GBV73_01670 [Thermococcus sp. 101 C5]|jgi:hypothetical protein|uniref:hypothetical protein n=1 Tax=Thermococcus TaxID=2263 RepID=UPI0005B27EF2|nr:MULTISPECIES: hypothetical protein [Thermococcus]MBC7108908.1 hypothetical protein [Methanomassiliicoccales archaeon]MCA6213757.1 hypothetical protein [Thermococcus bergensis]MPW38409.1 hypothetical protein [Thermococcus sp. 101 C5]HIH73283.1 hypothetical protein [Thermococcaceae archaeon]